jgi:hypothetical protein
MTTRAESTQYFSALQDLGRVPKSGESDHHRCAFGAINLPRSSCRARREPQDRISPIVHLVVESRPMGVVMLTLRCVSGQVRPTPPCRMQRCRGSTALSIGHRLPPPVRICCHGRHMHHGMNQHARTTNSRHSTLP